MQIIPDNINNTVGIRVFETPDDIIINSQVYDKTTFEPRPYNFFTYNVLTNYNLLDEEINRIGEKMSAPDRGVDYKHIMQDSEDPNIFYATYFPSGTSTSLYLGKFQKINGFYKLIQSTYYNSPNYSYNKANIFKFLGQNKDYILISENHRSYGGGTSSYYSAYDLRNIVLRRISKSDISSSAYQILYANNDALGYSANGNRSGTDSACFAASYYLMEMNESYAYIYAYCGDSMYINKYNIQNNTWTTLYTFPNSFLNNYGIGPSNIIKFKNYYYILSGNTAHSSYALQQISLNTSSDTVTINNIYNVSHTDFKYDANGFRTLNGINSYTYRESLPSYLVYTLKNVNDTYIALVVHHNEGGTPITDNNKLILIRYASSAFTITSCISITSCYGVLWYDDYTCVLLTQEGFVFYQVNTSSHTFVKKYEQTGTFYTIGFDALKRFYAITNSECKIYSNMTAVILNAVFEKTTYTYSGTSYESYVTISTKNFLDSYISTEVLLTLQGTCEFEDGTKKKTVTTSTSTMQIPVIITGGGKVYCNIKQTGVE